MLISLEACLRELACRGLRLRGVLHVGAHDCEELPAYEAAGVRREDVYWVEALQEKVSAALERGVPNVACVALDDVERPAALRVTNNGQSTSLLPLGTHRQSYPSIEVVEQREVLTKTGARYVAEHAVPIGACNFWNLDIQGKELAVLRGFGAHLDAADGVYVEVNTEQVYEGCCELAQLDAFLGLRGLRRVLLEMTQAGWGDAFYVRAGLSLSVCARCLEASGSAGLRGVLHVGAHECEELEAYVTAGLRPERVHWVEALPEKVSAALDRNVSNVTCAVLDEREGPTLLHVPSDTRLASLLPSDGAAPRHVTAQTGARYLRDRAVPLASCNYWHLSVEGRELAVLRSFGRTLDLAEGILVRLRAAAELPQLDALMEERGFRRAAALLEEGGRGEAFYVRATAVSVRGLAAAYYINLGHRQDRRFETELVLQRLGLAAERFGAERHLAGGAVGCTRSHLALLKLARARGHANVLVLEDDVDLCVPPEDVRADLEGFFASGVPYDVLMLAHYTAVELPPYEGQPPPPCPPLRRALEVQTASAYVVHARFLDRLIATLEEAAALLQATGQHWFFMNDQYWKRLQPQSEWLCVERPLCRQRASFSDLAGSVVNYGV
jgi:hypothetical protein